MEGGVAQGRVPGWPRRQRREGGVGGGLMVTHTPKLHHLERGVSEELLYAVLELSSSRSGFCSGLATAWGPEA